MLLRRRWWAQSPAVSPAAVGVWLVLTVLASSASVRAQPEPEEQIEVTVRGQFEPPASSRDPTAASTVVRKEDLETPGASSADVLSRVPGVEVNRTGAQSDLATASVRGASSAQTPIYLSGVRLNDDVTGTADLSTLPLWMLDRVEVFRGNAPEHADQLGLGGAVFFEPRWPRRTMVSAGQLFGSYGAVGMWLSGAVTGTDASALASVRRDSATNDYPYRNDQGTVFTPGDDEVVRRQNADYRSYDAWTIGRYRLGRAARIVTVLNAFDREQGVTGLAVIPAHSSRAQVRRQLAGISAAVPCSRSRRQTSPCRLELVSTALIAQVAIDDPLRELSLQTTRMHNDGQRLSQTARLQHTFGEAWTLGFSASQSLEYLRSLRARVSTLHARRAVTRGAVNTEVRITKHFSLFGLGAVECHSTAGPEGGQSCGVLEPIGRVGAKLQALPWLSLLGNLGRYVRVPTLGELYGASPLVLGNERLVPETGIAYDLGLRAARSGERRVDPSAYLDAFVFRRHTEELIAYQRTSFRQIRPYNVGSARVQGAEIAAGTVWLDALRAETALTLLDPRDTTPERTLTNDILPYHSRLVLSQLVQAYARSPWGEIPVTYVALGVRVSHRSSRHQNPAGLGPIPHHSRVDVESVVKLLKERLALRAWVANLLDSAQYDMVGLPLPGRSLFGSAELTWW